jgi:hypothetical protein
MFDLNQILSAALNAAVAEAIKPLVERIEKLEFVDADRHERLRVLEGALTDRVAALENNPAIGTDTVLAERVLALEQRMDHVIDASEKRIREIAEAAAEQVMEDHTSSYDHDDYDNVYNEWGSEEVSDFVKDGYIEDQIEEKVKEVLNNATVSISI